MKYQKDLLIICENYIKDINNKYSFIGIFDYVFGENLPIVWPSLVLAGRAWFSDKTIKSINVHVAIKDPDDKVIVELPDLTIQINSKDEELAVGTFTYQIQGLKFDKEGIYKFEVKYDDELLGHAKLKVFKATN